MKELELGEDFTADLNILIDTRTIMSASSGGGKSHGVRKLVEETHGKHQIIILDPEGEFETLREKFPFILAGKGGDISADVRHAGLLARKTIELGMDLIVDLYELIPRERVLFMRRFLEGLDQMPKNLYAPRLVVIDEAHIFAPENGSAESSDAVAALVSRGRKRGLGAVLCTQRIAKLSKDVVAECRNKLMGLQNQDIDRKRTADELGFSEKKQVLALRDLEAGWFYAVGPAFKKGVNLVQFGSVQTRHPKAGSTVKSRPVAPDAKIKATLEKLAEIPKEVEQEAQTITSLNNKIKLLEAQVRVKALPVPTPITQAQASPTQKQMKVWSEEGRKAGRREARKALKKALDALKEEGALIFGKATHLLNAELSKELAIPIAPTAVKLQIATVKIEPHAKVNSSAAVSIPGQLDNQQQRILDTIAMLVQRGFEPNREMVARWMGIHPTGGRYGSNLAVLRQMGMMEERGATLTSVGQMAAKNLATGFDEFRKTLDGSRQAIVDVLEKDRETNFSRESLAEALGLHPTGGRYGSNLALLRAMGAIPERGHIKLVSQIFI